MKAKRMLCLMLCCSIVYLSVGSVLPAMAAAQSESSSATLSDYERYLAAFGNDSRPTEPVKIAKDQLDAAESSGVRLVEAGVETDEGSTAVFRFIVEEAGQYALNIRYTTVSGAGTAIQRELLLDGKTVYSQAGTISLPRIYRDSTEGTRTDSNGNEYTPEQVEVLGSYTQTLYDGQGYLEDPLLFCLAAGEHTLTLVAAQEPVILEQLKFFNEPEPPAYAELKAQYDAAGYQPVEKEAGFTLQAEESWQKSSPSLYPVNDRTSSLTQPASVDKILMNTMGGTNWRYPRQWISWKIQVRESGLYTLSFRFKQNYIEGQNAVRRLTIDGELPFAEAKALTFGFNYDWQITAIGGDTPYQIYFEAGREYILTLENTLGDYGALLQGAQSSIQELNRVYRRVRMIVGTTVDKNRDYAIEEQFPECVSILQTQYGALQQLAGKIEDLSGGKGNGYAAFQRLFVQLDSFLADTDRIPKQLDSFSNNIRSLSDYVLGAAEQPLLLDYIRLDAPGQPAVQAQEGFLGRLLFEIRAFFASFVTDYSMVGGEAAGKESLQLWLSSGRDQAQVMKKLVNNSFSKTENIAVDVRLVTADAILPAVVAGKGPDVAVGQAQTLPVRYGLREALLDLSAFSDYTETLERFAPSAYTSFRVGEALYALPDTQSFLMMYLREDILSEFGLETPNEWQELYHAMYLLQQNNLEVGFPNIDFSGGTASLEMFYLLLLQQGGSLFTDDLSATRLDEPVGVAAFTEWSELYTKYKATQQMNHLTRFRTGEAPIVFANLEFCNTLSLYAPEIRGLWRMAPIPGVKQADGTIDRSIAGTVTGAVAFANTKQPEACWAFLKWWTSAEAQTNYAWEMENVLGVSGRVMTANLDAFNRLAWSTADRRTIADQREYVRGVPEIAGSYVFDRYLCTALRYTIERNADPREMLLEWNKKINTENHIRRQEFGME